MINTIQTLLFYAFSAVLLLAAFRVITSRNPVHAVMYLVLAFFQAAAIWLLIKAEFLAVVLVLVYVGAVMVLFLFVLMMINFDVQTARQGFWKHFPLAAAIGIAFMVELGAVFMVNYRHVTQPLPPIGADGAVLPEQCPIPMRWGNCSIRSTCTQWKSPPSCCCWRSLRPLR